MNVVGISLTKGCGSNTVELDDEQKLFDSSIEPTMFAQAERR